MSDTRRTAEREAAPQMPTSGQALGALAKILGFKDPWLNPRTVRRFSSGRLKDRVKDSTRKEIIDAISDAVDELGLGVPRWTEDESKASSWATILDWHALNWDRMRAFLLPRMMRVLPRHHAAVWQVYVRLVAIDLALRAAALMRLTETPPAALDFLDWISVECRGAYLNKKRSAADLSLYDFIRSVGVNKSAVERWLYRGGQPRDENLVKIAKALSSGSEPSESAQILRELRRLYMTSDVAVLLGEFIGAESVGEILGRLRRYASHTYRILDDRIATEPSHNLLVDIATFGSESEFSKPLLDALIASESDDEWKEDLLAAGSDWVGRILEVNLKVHQAEEYELIRETDGRILKIWDVSNPAAFAHYQRSMELQQQGRIYEALAEVVSATELDPLDPANHFTLGSAKGGIGLSEGNEALVKEALDSCWTAVTLDPNWILPWTEIGWLLLRTGRAEEAVEHLKGVRKECGPLDSRYYDALGLSLLELGELAEALAAFESSLKLNPDDPRIAAAASATALQIGESIKYNRYRKMARHTGLSERRYQVLELMNQMKAAFRPLNIMENPDNEIAALDAIIATRPTDPKPYFERARAYFVQEDDSRAISDLDRAISLDLGNAGGYLLRGIVYGYMNRYDRVVEDMSRAIRLSPGEPMAYYYRGMAYGELNVLDHAITDMSHLIRLSPDHVDAYRVRGDCHRYKGDYDQAIADYDTSLSLDSGHGSSYLGRGAAYRMKLEFDLAIADYDEVVRLDPENSLAYRFRGDAYLGNGDYDLAIADYDIAVGIASTDEVAYRGRGNAHLFRGEFELALGDFNAALECDPESALAYYARAMAHKAMGNSEEAEIDRRRALELGYDDSV
ncbi:MAG: tetratricopeptide repeat protein [Dehalococcoidia bacterium]|nr:tetratricopeptide repeat protein [Dehalococcoidia bacterium]